MTDLATNILHRDDNVTFRDESGNATDAQLLAFEDTWHWGLSAKGTVLFPGQSALYPLPRLRAQPEPTLETD